MVRGSIRGLCPTSLSKPSLDGRCSTTVDGHRSTTVRQGNAEEVLKRYAGANPAPAPINTIKKGETWKLVKA
jgi:hypothetical protein